MGIRVFALAAVLASAFLLWKVDDGLEGGWPSLALHNWEEYGVLPLHGALVLNPGGFEAATHPEVYHGMSPAYLLPAYGCARAFRWIGLGILPFHIFLTVLVFWAIWFILGKSRWAFLAAVLAILSAGYVRWQKGLDPNAVSVLAGFPYAALAWYWLKPPRLSFQPVAGLILITAVFVPLNWTTAWFLSPFGIFLLLHPEIRRRRAVIYLGLTALGSALFVALSMWDKQAGNAAAAAAAGSGGIRTFLGSYMWGNYGYYEGLGNARFFLRLLFVNLAALLPMLCWWGWRTARCAATAPRLAWISLLPLAMAVAEAVAMRNYFCHHPWMGAPVFLTGLVFSLALQNTTGKPEAAPRPGLKWLAGAGAGAFAYSLAVLMVLRANESAGFSLGHLVQGQVPRTEAVAVIRSLDPQTASIARQLSDQLDRHFITVETLNDLPAGPPAAILSSRPMVGLQLLAESGAGADPAQMGCATRAAEWFNHTIARRKLGDKTLFAPHYYLYRFP